jgi:hypothetical protein
MINCVQNGSPLSILHQDTKLILGALNKAKRNPNKEKVILPFVVTEFGVSPKDSETDKATFVGVMFLDQNDNFYFDKTVSDPETLKVAVPILVNHKLLLNKTSETILKLLEENLKFFNSLDKFHSSILFSALLKSGIKSEDFLNEYFKRITKSYLLEILTKKLVDINYYVLEDRLEVPSENYRLGFTQDELLEAFNELILESSLLGPFYFFGDFRIFGYGDKRENSADLIILNLFNKLNNTNKIKALKTLKGLVYNFESPQSLALTICKLWRWTDLSDRSSDTDLVVLASETISALISSKKNDIHLDSSFANNSNNFERLFSYIFFQTDYPENKNTFIKELEKWFSSSEERFVFLKNNVILTLLLREDLKLSLDEKILQAAKNNPEVIIIFPSDFILHDRQKDYIWKSFYYDSLDKKVSELIEKISLSVKKN